MTDSTQMERRENMLTVKELAVMLSLSSRTLDNWRSTIRGPAYVRLKGAVRSRVSDVVAWLERQRVQTLESVGRGR
ncbi:MAG: helix-turn-helix domain-containing protein [Actinomyces sp.]|uniref:helix-turn-helix transcriptional regulator n=1 Tax=Actinomyces sp. TaxID=29317 RepID=UPI0026DA6F15|nr:helix-turn-helix domain-containing protein [Actinomyces sp.]MDO4243843.1 helix-turn-helix domain-containing protein [Actinomyces sp.]